MDDDKSLAIGILKQQRNQALDALADASIQITKQAQGIAELRQRVAAFEALEAAKDKPDA